MDLARDELRRIISQINPHSWACADDRSTGVACHRYYFVDRCSDETGDTSLHRLVALHAPTATVRNFLYHAQQHVYYLQSLQEDGMDDDPSIYGRLPASPPPPAIDAVNYAGVTALHVAVHRNSWHVFDIIQVLLNQCPRLASMPMSISDSYPLHILTGQCVTIQAAVLKALLAADGTVATKEDVRGDTPLSLLWKNVLRFRWARCWERTGQVPDNLNSYKLDDLSWMTVIVPQQFRDYCLLLVQAGSDDQDIQKLSWHHVCSAPRCPPLLVRILLQQPEQLSNTLIDRDRAGRLPLHCAAASPFVTMNFVPAPVAAECCSTQELILRAAPVAARAPDDTGRFPLHYAVAASKNTLPVSSSTSSSSSRQVASFLVSLVRACPEALMVADPMTGLYPAQQLATTLVLETMKDPPTPPEPSPSLPRFPSSRHTFYKHHMENDDHDNSSSSAAAATDMLYGMLRTTPAIVNFHR